MTTFYADLTQYLGPFSVLRDLPAAVEVPPAWEGLLRATAPERVNFVISLWEHCYPHAFSALLGVFRQCLLTVEVLAHGRECRLLYVFRNPRGQVLHYLGHAPVMPRHLPATLQGFPWPDLFALFYTQLHNGWYEVVSHAVGLLPLEETFRLSTHEWGILESLELPRTFSLANVVSVFSSGAGGYLCWDFNAPAPAGLIWWDDEAPDAVDFWDLLDEWSAMGIRDY